MTTRSPEHSSKTLKYLPAFPESFASLARARQFSPGSTKPT